MYNNEMTAKRRVDQNNNTLITNNINNNILTLICFSQTYSDYILFDPHRHQVDCKHFGMFDTPYLKSLVYILFHTRRHTTHWSSSL